MKTKVRMLGTSKGVIIPSEVNVKIGEVYSVIWNEKVIVLIKE